MADSKQITGGVVDCPLAFYNAVSNEGAKIKGIVSPVAGKADILVVRDLESDRTMKKLSFLVVVVCLFGFVFSTESFAQPETKGGGWGSGSKYKMYDPNTVETLSGEVVSVDKITLTKGMSYGVHLTSKTDKETISVHLGPAWYIEKQEIKIKPGDKIEAKGSKITYEGKPAIIAAEVKKGDEILRLRD